MAAEAVLLEVGKAVVVSLTAWASRRALKAVEGRQSAAESPILARVRASLEGDMDKISAQVASLAASKRFAMTSYLENGVLLLKKSLAELEHEDGGLLTQAALLQGAANLQSDSLNRAMEWFREAYKAGTEVFGDKRNVPVLQRLEALEVLLFCQTLENWADPKLTAEAWSISLRHLYQDTELITLIKANLKKDSIFHKTSETEKVSFAKLVAIFTQLEAYVAAKEIPVSVRQLLLAQLQRPEALKEKYHYFHHPKGGACALLSGLGWALKIFSGGYSGVAGLPDSQVALLRVSDEEASSEIELRACADSRLLGAVAFPTTRLRAVAAYEHRLFALGPNGGLFVRDARNHRLPESIFAQLVHANGGQAELTLEEEKDADSLCPIDAENCVVFKRRKGRGRVWLVSLGPDNPEPLCIKVGASLELSESVELCAVSADEKGIFVVAREGRGDLWAASLDREGHVLERNRIDLKHSDLKKAEVLDWAWDDDGSLILLSALIGEESEFLLTSLDKALTKVWSEERLTSEEKQLTGLATVAQSPTSTLLCLADLNYPDPAVGH